MKIQRGCRQGTLCPHCCLLLWKLAIAVRSHDSISGITIGQKDHRLAFYADDMIVFLKNTNKPIPALLDLIGNLVGCQAIRSTSLKQLCNNYALKLRRKGKSF